MKTFALYKSLAHQALFYSHIIFKLSHTQRCLTEQLGTFFHLGGGGVWGDSSPQVWLARMAWARPLGYPALFGFLEVCCEESHLQKALPYNFTHTVLSTWTGVLLSGLLIPWMAKMYIFRCILRIFYLKTFGYVFSCHMKLICKIFWRFNRKNIFS